MELLLLFLLLVVVARPPVAVLSCGCRWRCCGKWGDGERSLLTMRCVVAGRGRLVLLVPRLPKDGGGVKGLYLSPLEGRGKGRGFNVLLRPSFNADDGRGKGEIATSLLAFSVASSAAAAAAADTAEGSSLSHSFVAFRRDCRKKCSCCADRAMARPWASCRYREV